MPGVVGQGRPPPQKGLLTPTHPNGVSPTRSLRLLSGFFVWVQPLPGDHSKKMVKN